MWAQDTNYKGERLTISKLIQTISESKCKAVRLGTRMMTPAQGAATVPRWPTVAKKSKPVLSHLIGFPNKPGKPKIPCKSSYFINGRPQDSRGLVPEQLATLSH